MHAPDDSPPALRPLSEVLPARYRPYLGGRYRVVAGLSPLGTDFGNGPADGLLFQLDNEFTRYRHQKLRSRAHGLQRYFGEAAPSASVRQTLTEWMVDTLQHEYPQLFCWQPDSRTLHCKLTGERLRFTPQWQLRECQSGDGPTPRYASALDALGCQIQEDFAVLELDADHRERASIIHLCFPNHWSADQRIGQDFAALHGPVPHFEKIARQAPALVRSMIVQGPYVRFAWGLATDDYLDHHPVAPSGANAAQWSGRRFDAARPRLYVRVERQVIRGLPDVHAALFLIRTYITDCRDLDRDTREDLARAVESMSAQALDYKGLAQDRDAILTWLRNDFPLRQ